MGRQGELWEPVREVEGQPACPFCGSPWSHLYRKPHVNGRYVIFCVACLDCDTFGPWHFTEEGAVARWGWRREPNAGGFFLPIQAEDEARAAGGLIAVCPSSPDP